MEKDDFWDLLAMARSAYYAEVQRELWYKFRKENEDLTSIVIGTFITSSYVDIVLTFKDGEKMEKHTFTRSCTIIIPGGTPHGYYRVAECTRPFMFVQIQEAANRTEKFLWDYLSPEELEAVEHKEHWQDVGFDD